MTQPKLKRGLNLWSAVAVSVALMAPSMAVNINPQGTAAVVGRAVPLAFLLATVGVLLIAHTFVRLSQRFSHAGSVYAFVGLTLGSRSGSVAGWLNAATYVFFGTVTSTAAGIFASDLVRNTIAPELPDWSAFVVGWIALIAVWCLSIREIKGGTAVLLVTEALTVTLILVVCVVTVVKLTTGSAPGHQHFDLSVFTTTPEMGISAVFLGAVFGFLSFAGFEGAATLGEEVTQPTRVIPRAILGTALFGGLFFVVVTAIEMMAFGTNDAGVDAFKNSDAVMGDIAARYVGGWVSDAIVIGATVSSVACCLASVVGASRLVYALSRDGLGPSWLAPVDPQRRVPRRAATACVLVIASIQLVSWLVLQAKPYDVFTISGTAGTLVLLVAYGLATLGVIRLFMSRERTDLHRWEVLIAIAGVTLLAYTLYSNVVPLPTGTALWGPVLAVVVVVMVVSVVVARPAAAAQAGTKLLAIRTD